MKDVHVDGAWRVITSGEVYQGAWKAITRGEAYVGGAWVAGPVAAYSPGFTLAISAENTFPAEHATTITSEVITVTPSGGTVPFTYAWTRLSGAGIALSPTSASTVFQATSVLATKIGVFRCTATDALGNTATAEVTLEFTNTGG